MRGDRRIAVCIPEWVLPEVDSYQMRCASCPTRVWVSTLMLNGITVDGIEPFCIFCARRAVLRAEVDPIMSITSAQVRFFAEHGLLEEAYDCVGRLNESRPALLRHLDDMTARMRR